MNINKILTTVLLLMVCSFCICQNSTNNAYFSITYTPSSEILNEYDTLFNISVTIHDVSSIPACAGVKIKVIKINDNSVVKEISRNLVSLSNSNHIVLVEKVLPSEYVIEIRAMNANGNEINSIIQQ